MTVSRLHNFCPECEQETTTHVTLKLEEYSVGGQWKVEVPAYVEVCDKCKMEICGEFDDGTLIFAYLLAEDIYKINIRALDEMRDRGEDPKQIVRESYNKARIRNKNAQ